LRNDNDKEDEYINREQYKLAQAITKMAQNKQFIQFAVETAKQNEGTISYDTIFKAFPWFKPLFANTAIAARYGIEKIKTVGKLDATEYDFVHNKFGYDAIIHIPNFNEADANQSVIVSPALQIWDDIANDNPDIIFAWEILSNDGMAEINVGEKDILSHPTLITSLSTVKELEENNVTNGGYKLEDRPNNFLEVRSDPRCRTDRFRINHSYDRSDYSEFWGTGIQHINTGSSIGEQKLGNDSRGISELDANYFISYVHFNFIGHDEVRRQFVYVILNQNITRHNIWYNTFERDWYAKGKPLGTVQLPNGKNLVRFMGRRVYQEEWYSFNPGPNYGDDPRGTLSHLRDLKLPEHQMHTSGEIYNEFDQSKGDMLFIRN
jgi:hypothetical protein